MVKVFRHIVVAAVVLCVLFGCSGKGRIIPENKMAAIYAEMFLADQWVQEDMSRRKVADTTDFYGAIFKKHGYKFKDFDASVNHYLTEPETYVKILEMAVEKLSRELEPLQAERDSKAALEAFMRKFPEFERIDFKQDTILKIRLWNETLDVPMPYNTDMLDSLALEAHKRDSLRLDSLRLDSLRLDSLRLDSLRLDSLRRDSLRLDSLKTVKDQVKEQAKEQVKEIEKKVIDKTEDVKRGNSVRTDKVQEARKLPGDKPAAIKREAL